MAIFTVSNLRLKPGGPCSRIYIPQEQGGPFTYLVELLALVIRSYSPGTNHTEDSSSIIACSLVAGETTCPESCSLATAVVLSPVYTAVTWQLVYMSQYL
jgi:hypothetical protein